MEIKNVDIIDELKQSYLDYAMDVIMDRALPDARDGLKPVHRRSLYAMHDMHLHYNNASGGSNPTVKSARVVGEVIGKYHPHGDSAVYETIARMAQAFSLRYPLVVGQGNFGSIDGDSPAAMRYTEVKLQKISDEILADLDKDTVDFKPNYDSSLSIPDSVLPTKIPNLLVNGSQGIAVGLTTNIPPHNLTEVLDATLALIDDPDLTVDQLISYIPGPDFPTGGQIYGRAGIVQAYRTGRGTVITRAKYEVEHSKETGLDTIKVVQIPYGLKKSDLVSHINTLVKEKKIEGIADISDVSTDENSISILLELKKDAFPEIVANQLFQNTRMQSSFSINIVAIVDGRPKQLNLKECLECFIKHRKEVVTRRTAYLLAKTREEAHILEAKLAAYDNMDEIVRLIRTSEDRASAKAALLEKAWPAESCKEILDVFGNICRPLWVPKGLGYENDYYKMTEVQVDNILDMRLAQLVKISKSETVEKYNTCAADIKEYLRILGSLEVLLEVIKGELEEVKQKYGDERRTEITDSEADLTVEDLITPQDVVITMSSKGYVKYMPVNEYKSQKRGGRGIIAAKAREDDFVENMYVANNLDYILCLTSMGQCFGMKVYKLPSGSRMSRGQPMNNVLALRDGEKVSTILVVKDFTEDRYIVMATAKGVVKKCKLSDFAVMNKNGKRAISLRDDDELIGVGITDGHSDIMLLTAYGKALKFNELISAGDDDTSDDAQDAAVLDEQPIAGEDGAEEEQGSSDNNIRCSGRQSGGVRGIKLAKGDKVVSLLISDMDSDAQVLSATENGYGKRTPIADFPRKKRRAGGGVNSIRTNERNGLVIGALLVHEDDHVMLINSDGNLIRTRVAEIRECGRVAAGVRLVRVQDGCKLISLERVACPEDTDVDITHIDGDESQDAGSESQGSDDQTQE